MGFLANVGAQIGEAFSPPATAQGTAGASLGWGTLATGANVGAQLAEGIGGAQRYEYAAKVAGQNAQAALTAGQEAESASKMKYGALEAEQKAAQAANGIQVTSGTAEAVRRSTEAVSAMDAALIHYNAARQAFGEQTQASLYKQAATGSLIKGALNAGVSFLSGAESLSDKALAYRRSGAYGGA